MNATRTLAISALASMLVACVDDGSAPEGAQLLLPDAVRINWHSGFDGVDDGLGALVPIDLMVFEGSTGEPLEEVDIRFASLAPAAEILAASDIDLSSRPCDACVWDAGRDRHLSWRAGTSSARTDADGLARVYVWVDAFPVRAGAQAPVEIAVALSTEGAAVPRGGRGSFQILPD